MKLINALVYSLVLCVSFVSVAEAKGRSGSFKGGFSSQKRSAPKPAKTYYTPAPKPKVAATAPPANASFGAFGNSKTVDANAANKKTGNGNFQPSQMSKDLDANAARTNALKTADARNASNTGFSNGSTGNGNTNSNGGWFGGDRRAQPHYGQQPAQPTSHQTVIHERSGGFLNGVMWFMLGNSLAHHNTQYVPVNNQAGVATVENGRSENVNGEVAKNESLSNENFSQQNQIAPVEENESFFMKLLRFVLWIAVIWSLIWIVRKVMHLRKHGFNRTANYTL